MPAMLDYLQSLLPPWIAKGPLVRIGTRLYQRTMAGFGQVGDSVRDDAAFGVREAMIEECTDDAYPHHLRNSNLQVVTGESAADQLAQLRRRWLTWRESGGYEGMQNALARIGYPSSYARATLDIKILGGVNPFNNFRNFFYVRVNAPNQWGPGVDWDGGPEYDDGSLWGLSGGTREELELLFFTIQKFKPFTHTCRYVEIQTNDGTIRVIPMHERWELNPNGAYNDYYNHTWATP